MWIDIDTNAVVERHDQIRAMRPLLSLPANLTEEIIESIGFAPVVQTTPTYNPLTQVVTEGAPAFIYDHWEQTWIITDLDSVVVDAKRQATINQQWEAIKAERDRRTNGGVKVLINGSEHWLHTDMKSKVQHLGNKDTARDQLLAGGAMTDPVLDEETGEQILWKALNPPETPDVWIPLTCQIVFDIVRACKKLEYTTHKAAEAQGTLMRASSDPATYNFMQDEEKTKWPIIFEDVFGTQT